MDRDDDGFVVASDVLFFVRGISAKWRERGDLRSELALFQALDEDGLGRVDAEVFCRRLALVGAGALEAIGRHVVHSALASATLGGDTGDGKGGGNGDGPPAGLEHLFSRTVLLEDPGGGGGGGGSGGGEEGAQGAGGPRLSVEAPIPRTRLSVEVTQRLVAEFGHFVAEGGRFLDDDDDDDDDGGGGGGDGDGNDDDSEDEEVIGVPWRTCYHFLFSAHSSFSSAHPVTPCTCTAVVIAL